MNEQPENLLGEANAFIDVLEQVSQVAKLNKPVLVIGERGTGKELIATACTTSPTVGKAVHLAQLRGAE
ncbi:Phage shock protein F [Serratia marcescens]|uniref:Phage shock protein F n=1 Tax=Serratia marcescens TaxID=615 RepID=A0A379ZG93_SERMA|nr:Phage shock protein F [Serratia marcescens]